MPSFNIVIDYNQSRSARCRQIEAVFDVPAKQRKQLKWKGNIPIEDLKWSIGLIVGPSGSGKSTIAKNVFGKEYHPQLEWKRKSVLDDFENSLSISEIASACQAVGFNTIPAWIRPFSVLSNGEKFRVDIARRLLELSSPIVIDEFSSVVDRQVAKICSYAVQKFARKMDKQLVAISCHDDIEDWLNPDWVYDTARNEFRPRGSLQQIQRPPIECQLRRVPRAFWRIFAPFHYLTPDLSKSAKCFALFVNEEPVSFVGLIRRAIPRAEKKQNLIGVSRLVTLPDWQGLGLGLIQIALLGAMYQSIGFRIKMFAAHPALIRSLAKRPDLWKLMKKPGIRQMKPMSIDMRKTMQNRGVAHLRTTISRPCAIFEYIGPVFKDRSLAFKIIQGKEIL